jgi:hypothetical protein
LDPEEGGNTSLRNIGKLLPDYTASHRSHENLKSHNKYNTLSLIIQSTKAVVLDAASSSFVSVSESEMKLKVT